MKIEVWLYGSLARYAPDENQGGYAQLHLELAPGSSMSELLEVLGLPLAEKGITFVNGQLTDMPGLAADLCLELKDGDRVGVFDRRSMWPFQYRFGANVGTKLVEAMLRREGGAIRHSPTGEDGMDTASPEARIAEDALPQRGGDAQGA